jgi:hypothetical protein
MSNAEIKVEIPVDPAASSGAPDITEADIQAAKAAASAEIAADAAAAAITMANVSAAEATIEARQEIEQNEGDVNWLRSEMGTMKGMLESQSLRLDQMSSELTALKLSTPQMPEPEAVAAIVEASPQESVDALPAPEANPNPEPPKRRRRFI